MVALTPLSVCSTFSNGLPTLKLIFRLRKARSTALEMSSSSAATSRGSASRMVTSAPKDFHTLANSTPMTPPPSTIAELGTRSSFSACSLVSTRLPSTSRPGSERE